MFQSIRAIGGILAFASLASFASAIPASSVSAYSNDGDRGLNLKHQISRATKEDSKNQPRWFLPTDGGDGGNQDGDEINTNTFQVPGTNTTIVLYVGTFCPASVMEAVLNGTYNFMQAQLAASGDGQLPQDVDPFYFDLNKGAFFTCQSVSGQHLTWGILGAATGWLLHHMGEQAAYRKGANFAIHDSQWGLVGTGQAKSGYTGKALPTVVGGPDGVTHYT